MAIRSERCDFRKSVIRQLTILVRTPERPVGWCVRQFNNRRRLSNDACPNELVRCISLGRPPELTRTRTVSDAIQNVSPARRPARENKARSGWVVNRSGRRDVRTGVGSLFDPTRPDDEFIGQLGTARRVVEIFHVSELGVRSIAIANRFQRPKVNCSL